MLASRQMWWRAIVETEPEIATKAEVLDLAILFHDLNRSKEFRGKGAEADVRRADFARAIMLQFGIELEVAEEAIKTITGTFQQDDENETSLVRLLRDFDKSDMGAVGIYRMAAVACDRNYGIFARARDFDPDAPAIEGDDNLDSFAADICFCLEWWTKPKFAIRTPAIRRIAEPRFRFMM